MRAWASAPGVTSEIPDDIALEIDIALAFHGPVDTETAVEFTVSVDIERSAATE
jgi:hypothetical protein